MSVEKAKIYFTGGRKQLQLPEEVDNTWKEIYFDRGDFLPESEFAIQIFPPVEDFVNLHNFCLHLWEPGEPFFYSERVTPNPTKPFKKGF